MINRGKRQVVITGAGLVSPLGNSATGLLEALSSGTSGVSEVEGAPPEHASIKYAAAARDFSGHINDFGPLDTAQKKTIRKGLKVMCREIQMGVAAAQLALSNAGIEAGQLQPERSGVVFGSDYMLTRPEEYVEGIRNCMDGEKAFDFNRWGDEGLPKVTPLWLLKYLPNMPASHIAIYNDLRGPSNSITHREASSNLSLAEAFCTIVRGSADLMIAGATGTRVHPIRALHMAMQEEVALGDDPSRLSRPFDANRSGLVMGEGSGAVVLEWIEHARARNALILGEVIGYASSSVLDRHSSADRKQALLNVIRLSLRSAGVAPDQLGHINAHGLSTRRCDAEEAQAITAVFGDRDTPIPVVAAKGHFGNLGAGSGTIELIASLMAMQRGTLFPVLNYETPDPECPIAVVAQDGQVPTGDSCLNLNVTPQGQAAALLVRKFAPSA
jgi:3-oxoacyl-[acyl-carrier-protein] synthase II